MKHPDIDHPAIKEMIARRSGGNPDYVVGVRAYLKDEKEPAQSSVAYDGGYLDAQDMTAYLSELQAEAFAEAIEEEMQLSIQRRISSRCHDAARQMQSEALRPKTDPKQSRGIRI